MAATGDPDAQGRTIVVARDTIAFGIPLSVENLREVPWRSADTPDGAFLKVADLVRDGRRLALATFQRNEPILSAKITAPNQRATLSTQLDDGMRAVTVRVDEVRGVAGFVLPGDRVDIILTRGEGGGQETAAYADVLLQNAKVLAVDQLANERQDKPAVARAVTLEVTVQQAQKVVLAQGIGRLSLALRQANEAANGDATRVTASDLGPTETAARDRVAEVERRLEEVRRAAELARGEAERTATQRLSDLESRMRGEMLSKPATSIAPPLVPRPDPPSSVISVTRNGSKTEKYTVAAER